MMNQIIRKTKTRPTKEGYRHVYISLDKPLTKRERENSYNWNGNQRLTTFILLIRTISLSALIRSLIFAGFIRQHVILGFFSNSSSSQFPPDHNDLSHIIPHPLFVVIMGPCNCGWRFSFLYRVWLPIRYCIGSTLSFHFLNNVVLCNTWKVFENEKARTMVGSTGMCNLIIIALYGLQNCLPLPHGSWDFTDQILRSSVDVTARTRLHLVESFTLIKNHLK